MAHTHPAYWADLKTQFESYFGNEVQLRRDDKKKAYAQAMPIIQALVNNINKKDPRFRSEFIKVGSSFQGLKTGEPNEYDVNIPLMKLGPYYWLYKDVYYDCTPSDRPNVKLLPELNNSSYNSYYFNEFQPEPQFKKVNNKTLYKTSECQPIPPPGYIFVSSPVSSKYDSLSFDGDLIPLMVKTRLKTLIRDGVKELNLMG